MEPAARRQRARQRKLIAADETGKKPPGPQQGRRHSPGPQHGPTPRQKLGPKLREGSSVSLPAGPDDQVPRRLDRLQLDPPDLLEPPPETIAGHRGGLELRNDQSHARMARRVVGPDHVQMLEPATPAPTEAAANVGRPREPMGPRQARRRRQEPPCFDGRETVSRLRPFLRRRESTARPQREAMRARNPCLLMRRLFRGRYDGFMRVTPAK